MVLIAALFFNKYFISHCEKTTNQKEILSCVVELEKQNDLILFKSVIEKNYEFKFFEFDRNLLEHETDMFQKYYYSLFKSCTIENDCIINEKKFLLSKLSCLTYSKACFLQSRFIPTGPLKHIKVCEEYKCQSKMIKNLGYLISYLEQCNRYRGEDIFDDTELQVFFNKNKENICKNISIDYYTQKIEYIKSPNEDFYEFIDDSQMETLK